MVYLFNIYLLKVITMLQMYQNFRIFNAENGDSKVALYVMSTHVRILRVGSYNVNWLMPNLFDG